MVSLATFITASALYGLAGGSGGLLIGWLGQGAAAALMSPQVPAMISAIPSFLWFEFSDL